MVKEALAKHKVEEESEVQEYKTLLQQFKNAKEGKEVVVPKFAVKKNGAGASGDAKEDGADKAAAEAADEGAEA